MQSGEDAGLRVALLLTAPSGGGKATAVRGAAAALGLHVVPFSCHELAGQQVLLLVQCSVSRSAKFHVCEWALAWHLQAWLVLHMTEKECAFLKTREGCS